MKMNLIEAKGLRFHCRPGSSDEKTIAEVVTKSAYERKHFQILPDELWYDLGGNVGAFTVLAASKGAHVRTFEPDPFNVMMIKKNLRENSLEALIHECAVVADDTKEAMLNLWPKGQSWRNSLVRNKKGTTAMPVKCVNLFETINAAMEYCCIKMDIEGSEIAILEKWPETTRVRKLVFEWSFDVDKRTETLVRVIERLKKDFAHVKYTSQIERIKEWDFFPPCTMVHAWK